jgi:hypothetical protein
VDGAQLPLVQKWLEWQGWGSEQSGCGVLQQRERELRQCETYLSLPTGT